MSKLPTPLEVTELVKDKIITQEEAREILFNSETEEDRDKKSLESEIKFLRSLVENLSKGNNTKIVEIIHKEKQWSQYPWYRPYEIWCTGTLNAGTVTYLAGSDTFNAINSNTTHTNTFSDIKTF